MEICLLGGRLHLQKIGENQPNSPMIKQGFKRLMFCIIVITNADQVLIVPIPDSVLNNSLELIIAVTLVRTQLWCVLQKGACLAERRHYCKLNPDVELCPWRKENLS